MNYKLPPPILKDRPVVRVIAPSGTLLGHEKRVQDGLSILASYGWEVRFDRKLLSRCSRGYLAGSDDDRCDEMIDALTEPNVDIVWCARGGSGASRLLKSLKLRLKSVTPRWLIGFSDITSLLNVLSIEYNWVTIHGPTISMLGTSPELLSGFVENLNQLHSPDDAALKKKHLPLYGGNLTVLTSCIGQIDMTTLGKHGLLLEDVNEAPYRIDRALTQLRNVWPMNQVEYLWLGDFDLEARVNNEVVNHVRHDFDCAVILGAPAGHRGLQSYIPLGYPLAHPGSKSRRDNN